MSMCGICWFDGRALTDERDDLRNRVKEADALARQPSNMVLVPREPLNCQSISSSDYCYHCGRSMTDSGGPCKVRERPRLQQIPDSEVTAFGCRMESWGETRCDKWCHEVVCPFVLAAAGKGEG